MTRLEILKAVKNGADLSDADLRGADLRGADLRGADLRDAHLRGADLRGADLRGADLRGADLSGADLRGADLSDAALSGAHLRGADLRGADLSGAHLRDAHLRDAHLSDADLRGADLSDVSYNCHTSFFNLSCPETGAFIGYKKCAENIIVKLKIPASAKRSSATSRKCRASRAEVLEIYGADMARSSWDKEFTYKKGETVSVDNFNEDRWEECSSGIHFFISRGEAENY